MYITELQSPLSRILKHYTRDEYSSRGIIELFINLQLKARYFLCIRSKTVCHKKGYASHSHDIKIAESKRQGERSQTLRGPLSAINSDKLCPRTRVSLYLLAKNDGGRDAFLR